MLRSVVATSLVEQIPGWSLNRLDALDAGRHLLPVCLPGCAEQPAVMAVRCCVISQVAPFVGRECCVGREYPPRDVAVWCRATSSDSLRCVVHRLESDRP
jgi:hypothetical protein